MSSHSTEDPSAEVYMGRTYTRMLREESSTFEESLASDTQRENVSQADNTSSRTRRQNSSQKTYNYSIRDEFESNLRWFGMSSSVKEIYDILPKLLKEIPEIITIQKMSEEICHRLHKRIGLSPPDAHTIWIGTLAILAFSLVFLFILPAPLHLLLLFASAWAYTESVVHIYYPLFFLSTVFVFYFIKKPPQYTNKSMFFSLDSLVFSTVVLVLSLGGILTHVLPLNIGLPISICSLLFMLLVSGIRMSQHSAISEFKLTALIFVLIVLFGTVLIYYNMGALKESWHCWKYQHNGDLYKRCTILVSKRSSLELKRDEVLLEVEIAKAEKQLERIMSEKIHEAAWSETVSWLNPAAVKFPWEFPSIGLSYGPETTWMTSLAYLSFLLSCVLYFFVPVLNEFGKHTKQFAQLQYSKMNFKNPAEFEIMSTPGIFYGLFLFATDLSVWFIVLTIAFAAYECVNTGTIYFGLFFGAYAICYFIYKAVFVKLYTRLAIAPLQLMSRLVVKDTPLRIGTDIESAVSEKVGFYIHMFLALSVVIMSTILLPCVACIILGIMSVIALKSRMVNASSMTQVIFSLSVFFHYGPLSYTTWFAFMLQAYLWKTKTFKFTTYQTSDYMANGINEFNPQAPPNPHRARNDDLPP